MAVENDRDQEPLANPGRESASRARRILDILMAFFGQPLLYGIIGGILAGLGISYGLLPRLAQQASSLAALLIGLVIFFLILMLLVEFVARRISARLSGTKATPSITSLAKAVPRILAPASKDELRETLEIYTPPLVIFFAKKLMVVTILGFCISLFLGFGQLIQAALLDEQNRHFQDQNYLLCKQNELIRPNDRFGLHAQKVQDLERQLEFLKQDLKNIEELKDTIAVCSTGLEKVLESNYEEIPEAVIYSCFDPNRRPLDWLRGMGVTTRYSQDGRREIAEFQEAIHAALVWEQHADYGVRDLQRQLRNDLPPDTRHLDESQYEIAREDVRNYAERVQVVVNDQKGWSALEATRRNEIEELETSRDALIEKTNRDANDDCERFLPLRKGAGNEKTRLP